MQCDNCGGKIIINEVGSIKDAGVWANVYGFAFCDTLDFPLDQETCQDIFERKLWEAAQVNKQAKQKTASETPASSFNPLEMVDGYPF